MTTVTELIENKINKIEIISGEGEVGTTETYNGTRTYRAIKMYLKKEWCDGQQWANAKVYSHSNEYGHVFVDIETGNPQLIPHARKIALN